MRDKQRTEQTEIWKPIPGFEEWYSVSNAGRVRRDRTTQNSCAGTILKPTPQTMGYSCVQLFRGNKVRKCLLVHRLVALAFIGPEPKSGSHVNHLDGNRTNNALDNLEWCTPLENARHAREVLGYNPKKGARERAPRGEQHHKHILTQAQVDEIRRAWEESEHTLNQRALGRAYGVKRGAMFAVVHGVSWRLFEPC